MKNPEEFDADWCYTHCCAGRHKRCAAIGGKCKNTAINKSLIKSGNNSVPDCIADC